ncbi:Eco57I restriction-modification methylase domain-containing protein [Priestia aryabhattai]|uniref:Eco57I restriction-modification methylase domain-containing protein n=1 Tax=Priestia aryabhattai TaxID=412384 RepID=UPI002E245BF4|nr:Eco57I restriction-modification methylase domain-containing protein [Priestia aryabhattai]MED3957665.1 Eco57I restriction-modification methylase domain-containing protein [Priestia aryabhattai]
MVIDFLKRFDERSNNTSIIRSEDINKQLNEQYFTPMKISYYMASMFKPIKKKEITFMDAGAGVGNLTAAFIAYVCSWKVKPKKLTVFLNEVDRTIIEELRNNMELCIELCGRNNIDIEIVLKNEDFISSTVKDLKEEKAMLFDYIILNPPYKKLNTNTSDKRLLSSIGIEVPNYYAAFVSLSHRLLQRSGQLVCITPRSFCNGQYFKNFRNDLFKNIKIERIHLFDARKDIFYDDVLQETIIMFLTRNEQKINDNIVISESLNDDFSTSQEIKKRFDNVVFPYDQEKVIRLIRDDEIVEKMHLLPCTLDDLDVMVSTGPVVDFREKEGLLRFEGTLFSVPIIYPENFSNGFIDWPITSKKAGFLIEDVSNTKNLRPSGIYVLVKRMSSKEEKKRVVAAVYDSRHISNSKVAFDNKVNYYHVSKKGLLNKSQAKGLSLYLNSSLVDFYFRTFSGSTQVNVSDLKSLRYPTSKMLEKLGDTYRNELPSQSEIDQLINDILF